MPTDPEDLIKGWLAANEIDEHLPEGGQFWVVRDGPRRTTEDGVVYAGYTPYLRYQGFSCPDVTECCGGGDCTELDENGHLKFRVIWKHVPFRLFPSADVIDAFTHPRPGGLRLVVHHVPQDSLPVPGGKRAD